MSKRLAVIIAILIFILFPLLAQKTIVKGVDSSYAGYHFKLVKLSDGITESKITLAEEIASENGVFSLDFEVKEINKVILHLGIYEAYLFVEPGKEYHVMLPPFQKKSEADKLNPYFKPTVVHLASEIEKEGELNMQIRMFEDTFLPYLNKHINKLFTTTDFSTLDDEIVKMDKPFRRSKNEFFNNYRKYRYGYIRHLAYQRKSKSISGEFFVGQPVLFNNPAYWELFNQVYDDYFTHIARTDEGKKIGQDINSAKHIDSLRATVKGVGDIEAGGLLDLVVLKCLYKEFYDDNYSRSNLLKVIVSVLAENASTTEKNEIQNIAQHIYDKVTKLLEGYEPPEFELYDVDSNLVTLKSFKGKYVYLNFCTCFSYSCLSEFAQLQVLYKRHQEYLEIVTIIFDDDVQVMKDFLARSGYNWTFLHYGKHAEIWNDYDIRAFPTYYLIDAEGKLKMSPAPTPNDLFEPRLFKVLRADGIL
ncbi:MAG: TlpA family protein disulfide reductase [Bacteroidales bacterium]|nr:TlpA family protein disulfide reductase [Bacteroidales bacterium]